MKTFNCVHSFQWTTVWRRQTRIPFWQAETEIHRSSFARVIFESVLRCSKRTASNIARLLLASLAPFTRTLARSNACFDDDDDQGSPSPRPMTTDAIESALASLLLRSSSDRQQSPFEREGDARLAFDGTSERNLERSVVAFQNKNR